MRYRFVGGPIHGKIYDLSPRQRAHRVAVAGPMMVGKILDTDAPVLFDEVEYELRLAEMSGDQVYRRNGDAGWQYREWYFTLTSLPWNESERLLMTLPPPWQAGL